MAEEEEELPGIVSYDLKLYNRYRDRIRTIILCIKGYPASEAAFNAGSLGYNTTVVNMSDKDGKEKMIELWRDRKMVKFFKFVEEQGKKEGEKQGERKLLKKQIKSKFELEKLDEELNTLIDEADIEKIEEVAEIFYKLADIEKLKNHFK